MVVSPLIDRSRGTYGLSVAGIGVVIFGASCLIWPGLRVLPGTHGFVLIRLRCRGDVRMGLATTSVSLDEATPPLWNAGVVRD
jgi:hypothetical protein